jgi:Mg/Co/Ni transporter MgtE
MDMDWTMILVFSGLSIFSGVLVGLGTLSIVRAIFTALIFLGFAMTMLLMELGVGKILSFFLGQIIVVGSTYIYLKVVHPEILNEVKKEYIYDGPSHGC